ncbi:MAG: hypothetical protein ABI323_08560 [Solirubrobacteraceae bacterium]
MSVSLLALLALLLIQITPNHELPAGVPLIARSAVHIEQLGAL